MSFRRPTGSAFGVSLAAADRASAPSADAPPRPPPPSSSAGHGGGRPPPAAAARDAFLTLVDAHAAVIVVGDPGAGKTVALPRYLVEAGWGGGGQAVVVASPSQAAALAAAHAAAAAGGGGVGREVGYRIEFEDVCVPSITRLKYVTHDALLTELAADPLLSTAAAIVVDDADARTVPAADAALALLPRVTARRPDLRVVLTATDTASAQRLAAWWDAAAAKAAAAAGGHPPSDTAAPAAPTAALLSIPTPSFPVRLQYLSSPAPSVAAAAAAALIGLHERATPGDALCLLPTPAAVDAVAAALAVAAPPPSGGRRLVVVPLTGPTAADGRALAAAAAPAPRGERRALLATEAAVAGVGLPSLAAVVDSLLIARSGVDAASGLPWAAVAPVSRPEADARAARAGRARPGVCVRLATEADAAAALPEAAPAPLAHADLTPLLLRLKAMGVDAPLASLAWPDPPPPARVARGLECLLALGALEATTGALTPRGARMAELPLPPPWAAALLAGGDAGCAGDVATVAAVAGVQSIWSAAAARAAEAAATADASASSAPPRRKRTLADWQAPFAAAEGDAATWVNVWRAWCAAGRRGAWAASAGLDQRALLRAADVRAQLLAHARRVGVPVEAEGDPRAPPRSDGRTLVRALAAGLFGSAAALAPLPGADGVPEYVPLSPPAAVGAGGGAPPPPRLRLVRPSVLAPDAASPPPPRVVLYAQVDPAPAGGGWVGARCAVAVDAALLREVAPHYFS